MKIYRISEKRDLMVVYKNGLPIKVPFVYIRIGLPPLKNQPSTNWLSNKKEKGVSVYRAWLDPMVNKYIIESPQGETELGESIETQSAFIGTNRKAFLVDGIQCGECGSDIEPLLEPSTIKIIKEISLDDIVFDSDKTLTLSNKNLDNKQSPSYDHEPSNNFHASDSFTFPNVEMREVGEGRYRLFNLDNGRFDGPIVSEGIKDATMKRYLVDEMRISLLKNR